MDVPIPSASPPPRAARTALLGVVFLALALTATKLVDFPTARRWLADDRLAECRDHGDASIEFGAAVLDRERWRFAFNLRDSAVALAAGCLLVAFLRARGRRSFWLDAPAAGPIVGAALAALYTFVGQVELAVDGARDGIFTESEPARLARAFDDAVEPARIVIDGIPSDARIVVIDHPAPHVLKKFGYLVHPRRVFVPPHPDFRFSADEVRRILKEMPHGIAWCYDAGYTHLVDLTTLARTGDPKAIISLAELPR
jgi:hypothetical protein